MMRFIHRNMVTVTVNLIHGIKHIYDLMEIMEKRYRK